MTTEYKFSIPPHLVWVFPAHLVDRYNIAPRLEVTRELRALGWKVTLIAVGPDGSKRYLNVDFYCFSRPEKYLFRQIVFHTKVLRYLVKEWNQIDFVLFHQMSAPWILLLKPLRMFTNKKRPLFVMDTRTVPMEQKSKSSTTDHVRGFFYYFMNWLSNYLSDGQTAITERMAQAVAIPPNKLWGTWPSGVNLERFNPARFPRQWPMDNEPVRLIYVGHFEYSRNIMGLCQAVQAANSMGMAFNLLLVGHGRQQKELEEFARTTNQHVEVMPPIPHEKVPEVLSTAHVGVLPFPDEEKFQVSSPVKLFEYMGSGMAILATRIACHTDVIKDGDYAFWAEDASVNGLINALHQAWNSRGKLSQMGARAAQAARQWTWKNSSERLKIALESGALTTLDKRSLIKPVR